VGWKGSQLIMSCVGNLPKHTAPEFRPIHQHTRINSSLEHDNGPRVMPEAMSWCVPFVLGDPGGF
jgi:hypothetical protein